MMKIGKSIAVITTILMVALFVFNEFEKRHYDGDKHLGDRLIPGAQAKELTTVSRTRNVTSKKVEENENLTKLDEFDYSKNSKNKYLNKLINLTSTPIALVNVGKLYVTDYKGRLIRNLPLIEKYNLPVVTGKDIFIDSKREKIVSEHVSQCLDFLGIVRDFDYPLYQRISEIKWSDQLGMIAYLNDSCLPVILGSGELNRKAAFLSALLPQIEASSLTDATLYLDVRLKDQVILKKRT